MSPSARKALVAVALVVALWALWSWWRSPRHQVDRRLDALAGALSKDGDESEIASALAARSVAAFFAPGFLIRAQPYVDEVRDPQQLMGAVLRLRTSGARVRVRFTDRDFQLGPSGNSAVVPFVARATIDRGNGPASEAWRVRSLWIVDADGAWRISELELLERLENGGLFGR